MALKIKWLKRADNNLQKNLIFLEDKWGRNSRKKFILKLKSFITTVSLSPEIGKLGNNNIRSFVLVKQVTIFYKVTTKEIVIVNLFFNRQNPTKKHRS